MKPSRYVAVFSLLNALTFCLTHSLTQAGEGNNRSHRGDQSNSHKSSKGSANSNAQWAADPERGWVRADERHQIQEQKQATDKAKPDRGKHKAKGSKEKAHN